MKRIFIIFCLFGLILNSFSQDEIDTDYLDVSTEILYKGVLFEGWIEDSTTAATARDAGNGIRLVGNNLDLGGTLDSAVVISGAGNEMELGTTTSKLSTFEINTSGNLTYNSDANIIFNPSGISWTLDGSYWISAGGDTLATNAVVQSLIDASESVLPFNFSYTFSSTITDSRPGLGLFRLNNATLANVTEIYIDYFDANSVAKNNFLAISDTGTVVSVMTDVNNYALYKLTGGYTDNSNYYTYKVTYQSHNGVISGLSTIDLDISNSTGSGGGVADSTFSVVTAEDTLKQGGYSMYSYEGDNTDIIITDTSNFNSYMWLSNNGSISEAWLATESTTLSLSTQSDGTGTVYFVIGDGEYTTSIINDTTFADGTNGSTSNWAKFKGFIGSIFRADTIYVDALSIGGSEPIIGTTDSQFVMENTPTDSLTTAKLKADTVYTNAISISGSELKTGVLGITTAMELAQPDSIQIGGYSIRWNAGEGVHEFVTAYGDVVWQGPFEDLIIGYNNTGSTITNFTPCFKGESIGDSIPTIGISYASIAPTALRFSGVATMDIPPNTVGVICRRGYVRDGDASSLTTSGVTWLGEGVLTATKPVYPATVVIAGGCINTSATDGVFDVDISFALQRKIKTKSYSYTSKDLGFGVRYKAGFYDSPLTSTTLGSVGATVTYGSVNAPYNAHAFVVCGGVGTATGGIVGVEVSGAFFDDMGTLTLAYKDTIITDITAVALHEYYEGVKFVGTTTWTLITMSGSPSAASLTFNYGYAKYEDFGDKDFYLTDIEIVGRPNENDTGFNVELLKHAPEGWTYSAGAFVPGNSAIASFGVDLAPYNDLYNDIDFSWKRTDLTEFINGAGDEGVVYRITTTDNKAIQTMDMHLTIALD